MNIEKELEIQNYKKDKFEIDYFYETRGANRLEEIVIFLHEKRIEKTLENIVLVDNFSIAFNEIMFTIIGLFEDYLRCEINRNLLLKDNLKTKTLKSLLEIIINYNLNCININSDNFFQLVSLRKRIYNHKILLSSDYIFIKECFEKKVFPSFICEILKSKLDNLFAKFKTEKDYLWRR